MGFGVGDFIAISAALGLASNIRGGRPVRDSSKGCGKAKRKERKRERQNRKKGRR